MAKHSTERPRRGQAALEFLTTYGWAIMVVLVMIGALAYFGVLSPTKYLPPKCVFTTGITCKDYIAENNGGDLRVRFVLENGLGSSISIQANNLNITYSGMNKACDNGSWPLVLSAGQSATFTCTSFGAGTSPGVGQRVKATFALNYVELGGAFVHPLFGELQTQVQ